MSHQLIITLLLLAAEVGLFVLCVIVSRRPIDPLKPRLIPYNIIMIFLAVAIFATIAHVISLLSGQQLMPRQRKGMR